MNLSDDNDEKGDGKMKKKKKKKKKSKKKRKRSLSSSSSTNTANNNNNNNHTSSKRTKHHTSSYVRSTSFSSTFRSSSLRAMSFSSYRSLPSSSLQPRSHSLLAQRGTSRPKSPIQTTHPDKTFHYTQRPGTVIDSKYTIISDIGLGTFGRVVKCSSVTEPFNVAIKIIRKIKKYIDSARIEADVLRDVNRQGGRGRSLCVRMWGTFMWEGHFCLIFEELGLSLYDLLKGNGYERFPMGFNWDVARDLVDVMEFLKGRNLVHTDIKLENILLDVKESDYVYQTSPGGRQIRVPKVAKVKLCDFGGATYDNERKGRVINTRQYRAPEVILELGWSTPSDMWSVGCVLAEISSGNLLFSTHSNFEHLALIERTLGRFPRHMIERSPVKNLPFVDGVHDNAVLSGESRRYVQKVRRMEEEYVGEWGDLLRGVLEIDPGRRWKASECLHSYFRKRI
ncbi:hypothetical protein TrST_g14023 [Triparma strigata]|uniref:Protein kinase domain-containing protein n=1 Tax=Triparma strigata TaxID=1606541 RepID=A0A9W7BZ82_9STRA|nr:hypothetical protein TrST_g14023 [Triparma strigata]